jgi:hypothetical protein
VTSSKYAPIDYFSPAQWFDTTEALESKVKRAREQLDAHVRDIVKWHFSPETGCEFWLEKAKTYPFNPITDVKGADDLHLFGTFEDDWLRGGPISRWVPKGFAGKPVYVFETGGTTGLPKSRMVIDDLSNVSALSDLSNVSNVSRSRHWFLARVWLTTKR